MRAGKPPLRGRIPDGGGWRVHGRDRDRARPPVAPSRPETADGWGYGPPRYLAADRVPLRAEALSGLTYDQLLDAVEPAELTEAEVHPLI
ncbi:DUF1877 family protein [Streptomyces sp. NPDC002232]|uniref:DUF1877 family protein n=1 Tax=Streptomyces sp. NPDC002232 TaxID=3364640 RepID=UPI00369B7F01